MIFFLVFKNYKNTIIFVLHPTGGVYMYVCVYRMCVYVRAHVYALTFPPIHFNAESYIFPVTLPCSQSQSSQCYGRETDKEWEGLVLSPDSPSTIDVAFGLHFPHFLSRDHAVLNYRVCLVYLCKLLGECARREPSTTLCSQRPSGMVDVISDIILYPEKWYKEGGWSVFRSPDCHQNHCYPLILWSLARRFTSQSWFPYL